MPVAPQYDFPNPASSSSHSHSPAINTPPPSDDRDEIDFLGGSSGGGDYDGNDVDVGRYRAGASATDRDVLDQDPIHGDLGAPLSFKRRQKPSALLSGPARLFAAFSGGGGSNTTSERPSFSEPPPQGLSNLNATSKDDTPSLDWYAEGPGRRVGYEDLTAIDWIFEYNKERQRLRALASGAGGLLGLFRHLVDASQVWVVLLLTGISVGAIAAAINIASDWLGDLKQGFCSSGPEGGHFYLSKSFCCYGYDQGSKCLGWKSWGEALGVSSTGGQWVIGYIFFLLFSVCHPLPSLIWTLKADTRHSL